MRLEDSPLGDPLQVGTWPVVEVAVDGQRCGTARLLPDVEQTRDYEVVDLPLPTRLYRYFTRHLVRVADCETLIAVLREPIHRQVTFTFPSGGLLSLSRTALDLDPQERPWRAGATKMVDVWSLRLEPGDEDYVYAFEAPATARQ